MHITSVCDVIVSESTFKNESILAPAVLHFLLVDIYSNHLNATICAMINRLILTNWLFKEEIFEFFFSLLSKKIATIGLTNKRHFAFFHILIIDRIFRVGFIPVLTSVRSSYNREPHHHSRAEPISPHSSRGIARSEVHSRQRNFLICPCIPFPFIYPPSATSASLPSRHVVLVSVSNAKLFEHVGIQLESWNRVTHIGIQRETSNAATDIVD